MKKFFLTMRFIFYPLVCFLLPCKIMDKEKFNKCNEGGKIIIGNHLSWMDPVYQGFRLPSYKRFLSKKENGNNTFAKAFLDALGVIFVNREKPELSSMRECVGALKAGETLSIYPEGTRNRDNRDVQQIHSGAALFALKGDAFVIPVAMYKKGEFFRRNYMGVGDPVDLSDLIGKHIDEQVLGEASERMENALKKTLEKLDVWVAEKGWKADKKEKRRQSKLLKKQYKKAKRDHDKNKDRT